MVLVLENALETIVEVSSVILELIGIVVMIEAAIRGFLRWIRKEEDGPQLEQGISTALEFLMCGEVLKTATASNMDDYIALGAIILLRFALAFEVHWEMNNKEKEKEKEKAALAKEESAAEEKPE